MTLETLLLFAVAAVGLSHIIVDSTIMAPMREWISSKKSLSLLSKLVECYQCCGFWSGIVMGLVVFHTFDPLMLFACGCASSLLSVLAAGHLTYLETISSIDFDDDE